jgi:hypothetical protein
MDGAWTGIINGRRFGRILLRELAASYRGLLIAMAVVGGVFIVTSLLAAVGRGGGMAMGGAADFRLGYFRNALFLGGFILTSLAFREVRKGGGGVFYFTLPGSLLEKFLAKLLLTSVGYAVGCILFFTAASGVSLLITTLLFGAGTGAGVLNPVHPAVLRMAAVYLVTQGIFLLGSIWFQRLAFLKTVLWVLIIAVGAGIVFSVAARLILAHPLLAGGGGGFSFGLGGNGFRGMLGGSHLDMGGLKIAGQVLLYAVLGPVCWLAAYFKLGETEV